MKREAKGQAEADYSKFTRKIFLQSVGMLSAAFAVIAGLYLFVWRENVGDLLVSLFQSVFGMSHVAALDLYHYGFREHFSTYFFVGVAITFFILLRFFLKRFTGYFDQINGGIDALIEGDGSEIALAPEMSAIEKKLKTVRAALEQRAQDARLAEQRKNDLVMYIAHDIRTPLTSVIGYLSLLDETPEMTTEQRARHVRIALDKAYRLEQFVDEFFEITRFNSGGIALSKKTIDLYYMLLQISDEFYPQLNADGKRIQLRADEDLTICGDPDKLARVFNNILKNAAQYSEAGSVIYIEASRVGGSATGGVIGGEASLSGDKVSIAFKNVGGIPRGELSTIFEKFHRLDAAHSTGTGGAGLGLAIAKEIVALHGGKIFAESDGRQTAFTVELPAVPDAEESRQHAR